MPRVQPAKSTRKVLPPPTDRAAMLERWKDFPAIDVVERRFNDPNDPGSLPILLKDEDPYCCVNSDHQNQLKPGQTTCRLCKQPARRWYVRYVNTSQPGRWSAMRSKGYVPVEVADLRDEQDVADLVKQKEGDTGKIFVRRGDRGQEVLVKQPLEIYTERKRLEREARIARERSARKRREDRAEALGQALGDEAGQAAYDGAIKEESFTTHKTTLAEEASGGDEEE
jgi:hypothetical protein